MNTFFRIAVTLSFLLILFNIGFNLVDATGAFPLAESLGRDDIQSDNVLAKLTMLPDGMANIWAILTLASAFGVVILATATHSVAPIGVYLFLEVFWTSWIRTHALLNIGGFIPSEFLLLITVGMIFICIAAVIGMFTGSG